MQSNRATIGLIPAAGQARRLPRLPCSKEIYPIDFAGESSAPDAAYRPRVAAHDLLKALRTADAEYAYIVLRDGKWDIPAYLRNGRDVGVPLGYLVMEHPYGVSFTLNEAYPFVQTARILMGFPDIQFRPHDAYCQLIERQKTTQADLVLGLFPARTPSKIDMVEVNGYGQVGSIVIKPEATALQYTWIIAEWEPSFTKYLHTYTERLLRERSRSEDWVGHEVHLGHAIQQAIDDGLDVQSVTFPEGSYVDIGTPDELAEATQGVPRPTK